MGPVYLDQSRAAALPMAYPDQTTVKQDGLQSSHPSFAKSRSVYTPIDDRGSVLARHFGLGSTVELPPRSEPANDGSNETPVSGTPVTSVPESTATLPQTIPSIPSAADHHRIPMSRSSSTATGGRPKLTVQIPSENSDHGSTAESASRDSAVNKTSTPGRANNSNNGKNDKNDNNGSGGDGNNVNGNNSKGEVTDGGSQSGVMLPPPSPSASALASAGAGGPGNPFARLPPPQPGTAPAQAQNNTSYAANNANIETPVSALPSRLIPDALLPSPSSFFPDWGFSGRTGPDSSVLPSPLGFSTPSAQTGPGFARDDESEQRKRKPEESVNQEEAKRVKT